MPSINQIPAHLLSPEKDEQLVQFIIDTPIDFPTARGIAHLWTKVTRKQLTADQWTRLEREKKAPRHA